MSEYYGIYHIRIPDENEYFFKNLNYVEKYDEKQSLFYKKIKDECEISKQIYEKSDISFTDYFIGKSIMGKNLTIQNFKHTVVLGQT